MVIENTRTFGIDTTLPINGIKGHLSAMLRRVFNVPLDSKPSQQLCAEVREIIDNRLNPPPFADPRDFLIRPSSRIEVRRLLSLPDIELLRWLPTIENENAFLFQCSTWFAIKFVGESGPKWPLTEHSDVHIHSHPITLFDKVRSIHFDQGDHIPSFYDFLSCSPIGRHFITSFYGITQYWPIDEDKREVLIEGLELYKPRRLNLMLHEVLDILNLANARFVLHPWEELSEGKLKGFISR